MATQILQCVVSYNFPHRLSSCPHLWVRAHRYHSVHIFTYHILVCAVTITVRSCNSKFPFSLPHVLGQSLGFIVGNSGDIGFFHPALPFQGIVQFETCFPLFHLANTWIFHHQVSSLLGWSLQRPHTTVPALRSEPFSLNHTDYCQVFLNLSVFTDV